MTEEQTPGFDDCYEVRDHLSPSSICKFARCPRLFFYSSGCRMKAVEASTAMTYGSAMHHAIPFMYDNSIDKAMAAFAQVWEDHDQDNDRPRNSSRV